MRRSKLEKELILRRLFDKLAIYMARGTTFNEIARLFFINGLTPVLEKPYGVYLGSKKEYVLQKLIEAQEIDNFPEKLANLIWEITISQPLGTNEEIQEINWALDALGFKVINEIIERKAPKELIKLKINTEEIRLAPSSDKASGLELKEENKEALLKLSPEFYGIGINLKVLYKKIKRILNFKKSNRKSKN